MRFARSEKHEDALSINKICIYLRLKPGDYAKLSEKSEIKSFLAGQIAVSLVLEGHSKAEVARLLPAAHQ